MSMTHQEVMAGYDELEAIERESASLARLATMCLNSAGDDGVAAAKAYAKSFAANEVKRRELAETLHAEVYTRLDKDAA